MRNSPAQKRSAIIYQSLYLSNLLLIPGLSFFYLLWLFYKHRDEKGWHRIHLYRCVQLSVLAGLFVIVIPLIVVFLAKQFEASIMIMIVYFVTIHASFVMLGMFNIARAMANKLPVF